MGYGSLLNRVAVVRRAASTNDAYGSPGQPTTIVVGTYPCAVTRVKADYTQNNPAGEVTTAYRLYFSRQASIKAGDLAVITGYGTWRLGEPYNMREHHIEVDGTWEGDA